MNYKIIAAAVIPLLLILTGIFSYLTIQNNWNFEIASYSIFLFTLSYILVLERVIPLKQEWKLNKNLCWIDLKHFIFSIAIFDALGKMLVLYIVVFLQEYFFAISDFWDQIPFVATYVIANLIGDFFPYLYHRISHKGNVNSNWSLFLWKIHSIHHLPTALNWLKTNWIHPVNMFLNTVLKMLPILLLGFSKEIVFLVGITHVVIAYLSHANIKTKKSFWDYLIVTPQIHHFHHSKKMEEAKNFGNIFPFWDLLFGSYYNRKGVVKDVGLVDDCQMDYPHENQYIKQLVYPVTSIKNCCK